MVQKKIVPATDGDFFSTPAAFADVDLIVNKTYLQNLRKYSLVPCVDSTNNIVETACFFPITRIVLDSNEDILQKLASVYASAGNVGANIAMLIRGYSSGEVEMFLGVYGEQNRINGAYPKARVLFDGFIGNFPGCRDDRTSLLDAQNTRILLNKCYDIEYNAVASVSCIASPRNERDSNNLGFYQGLDKLFETMSGNDYSVIIMAQPLSANELETVRSELENLYSRLEPYAKIQLSFNWSVTESLAKALSQSLTVNTNTTHSATLSIGKSKNISHSDGTFSSEQSGMSYDFVPFVTPSNSEASGDNHIESTSMGETINKAIAELVAEGQARTDGKTVTGTQGKTVGESVQLTFENKTIVETLNRISAQLDRLREGKGTGMFATAAYFLAPSSAQAQIAASTYKAIISGNNTNLEASALNIWTKTDYKKILVYLKQFQHPVFELASIQTDAEQKQLASTTPAVLTTSSELAISMGLPRNKVNGIPFRESVSFERNIVRVTQSDCSDDLRLGNVWHLDRKEKTPALLNTNDLTMHCFITGTTGSGKSNAVYGLLQEIVTIRPNVHFMVIEPAKGDYKNVFGHRADVKVYGTNNTLTRLLRLNPFRFRREVHVLEHIDSLIGIFKVCWPMEAAMPSVLKQAVERAYEQAGWNLRTSKNQFDDELFPCLRDVLDAINQIIDESNYSAEVKGNYKGALCTRLEELTTGLNDMIFVSDDLKDSELFEENVIVDLSRLNSDETKSLLAGLLIVRLKEYRQSSRRKITESLQHITVLEEAHNLLKRTEQLGKSSNMTSKAVEMLSNSMAEMRSSGESFIIVDQSPSKVDLSAIRNTNTKIVLRLPEYADRENIGGAMNLSEVQIGELAKLPTGVAAVYQNNWMGAVLVKLPCFPVSEEFFSEPQMEEPSEVDELIRTLARRELYTWLAVKKSERTEKIHCLPLSGRAKYLLNDFAERTDDNRNELLSEIAFDIFNTQKALTKTINATNVVAFKKILIRELVPSVKNLTVEELDYLIKLLLQAQKERDDRFQKIFVMFIAYLKESGAAQKIRQSVQGEKRS